MFIDDTYFVAGRTEVAGINITAYGQKSESAEKAQNNINGWIAEKEPLYLRAMLGCELYRHLHDCGSKCDNRDTNDGHKHHETAKYPHDIFERVRDILVDSENSRSPIAMYVYFYYERNRISFTTAAGERTKKTDSSTAVSPIFKLVSLWNDMVDWNFRIVEAFGRANIPVRPDFNDDIFHKINTFNL